jgi:hypothetical protein
MPVILATQEAEIRRITHAYSVLSTSSPLHFVCSFLFFETGSYYAAQDGLKLAILLPYLFSKMNLL